MSGQNIAALVQMNLNWFSFNKSTSNSMVNPQSFVMNDQDNSINICRTTFNAIDTEDEEFQQAMQMSFDENNENTQETNDSVGKDSGSVVRTGTDLSVNAAPSVFDANINNIDNKNNNINMTVESGKTDQRLTDNGIGKNITDLNAPMSIEEKQDNCIMMKEGSKSGSLSNSYSFGDNSNNDENVEKMACNEKSGEWYNNNSDKNGKNECKSGIDYLNESRNEKGDNSEVEYDDIDINLTNNEKFDESGLLFTNKNNNSSNEDDSKKSRNKIVDSGDLMMSEHKNGLWRARMKRKKRLERMKRMEIVKQERDKRRKENENNNNNNNNKMEIGFGKNSDNSNNNGNEESGQKRKTLNCTNPTHVKSNQEKGKDSGEMKNNLETLTISSPPKKRQRIVSKK